LCSRLPCLAAQGIDELIGRPFERLDGVDEIGERGVVFRRSRSLHAYSCRELLHARAEEEHFVLGAAARIVELALATFRELVPVAPALRQAFLDCPLIAAKSP
jgi:hypothetical protein